MDIRIEHDGSDITNHVIRYDREHKICTGIGMIELEVDYEYGATISPWDSIKVTENGKHAATYYVSVISEGQPSATIIISGQDNSKRLSDYFITDTYLIDYPSYTRYWIEIFLTEVGIDYDFTVSDMGSLLSNNTSLGLMSAYEQVIMLLQMSGWYITFNASGTAIIGKLDVTAAKSSGGLGDRDIIEIKVDKNDRMYRNRVVVWGNGDPETNRWVFADVSKPTKWDYDAIDKRTILISNSNIPSVQSAFMLANQALTEFARLNIEKYITVEDARDIHVGDAVNVQNKVFTGKGLVTTFGVSMSKSGLVSNIALDERCPRLFGFFNFGGYVYVGTFGSGVWRKNIQIYSGGAASGVVPSGYASGIIPTGWLDYSSGLMEMEVTDLHVNAGVLACITSSGQMYYSIEADNVWSGIPLSGIQVTYSGTLIEEQIYSGVMARACIIDRDTNFLRYAVDTRSGINYGDFLYETDPLNQLSVLQSGYPVSGYRSWIVDVNPYDGSIQEYYSVHVSGNYNFAVYDIENDGTHDYVEAMTTGSGGMLISMVETDFGPHHFGINTGWADAAGLPFDGDYANTMAYSGFITPALQTLPYVVMDQYNSTSMWDYTAASGGTANTAYVTSSAGGYVKLNVSKVLKNSNNTLTKTDYSIETTAIYTDIYGGPYNVFLGASRQSPSVYNFYFHNKYMGVSKLDRYDYNIDMNSYSSTTMTSSLPDIDDAMSSNPTGTVKAFRQVTRKHILYTARVELISDGFTAYLFATDLRTGVTDTRTVVTKIGTGTAQGDYVYTYPQPYLIPYGDEDIALICPYVQATFNYGGAFPPDFKFKLRRFAIMGRNGTLSDSEIYDWSLTFGEADTLSKATFSNLKIGSFNSVSPYVVYRFSDTPTSIEVFDTVDYNEVTLTNNSNKLQQYSEIYSMQDDHTTGIAMKQSDKTFTYVDPVTGDPTTDIPDPTGYYLYAFAGIDSFNGELFFKASTTPRPINAFSNMEFISIAGAVVTRRSNVTDKSRIGTMIGNFRKSVTETYFVSPGVLQIAAPMYLVLQRDGYDFNVIKSGMYQDRLDISGYSPLVTMGRTIESMETYFIASDNSVLKTTHVGISGYNIGSGQSEGSLFTLGLLADDYRYSDFEDTVESGTSRKILIAYSGSIGTIDIMGESTAFSGAFLSPSGYINRLEVSNYFLPDQYVFISVSGYSVSGGTTGSGWGFFQKYPASGIYMSGVYSDGYNPYSGAFVDYSSGYPQARTTIIRLDDKL